MCSCAAPACRARTPAGCRGATEAKVVAWLKEQGIDKKKLSREEFLKYAWQWKEKYGGIILKQLRRLGASCDWDRTRFTMDPGCYEAVIDVFVRLYDEGLIYRGVRMVNWDPKALTALSDEEVIYKEVHGKLFYLRYEVVGQPGKYVIVATTRPETILGDVAVCVHPEVPRYTALHGVKLRVPVVNREIPVITDTYVDREFGTGCLKITPAHDVNDYEIGLKYKLEVIDIFEPDGRVNDKVGLYVGMDRFDLRKQIVKDIKAVGLLEKEEDYTNKVGYSERTDVVIEPKLSAQWFLKMPSLAEPALKVVMDDEVPSSRIRTATGWRRSRTGVSRVSCGGGSAFRPITCPTRKWSWRGRPRMPWPKPRGCIRKPPLIRWPTCGRTRTCSTPGFRPGCGRCRCSTA